MSYLTLATSPQWPVNISRSGPSSFLAQAHDQLALTWIPLHSWQHFVQDVRPHCPCIHCPTNNHSSHLQHSSTRKLVSTSNACPQCQRQPKLPDHRFCSLACGRFAARSAPELKYLLPHHEMSIEVVTQFIKCWKSAPSPKVLAVYMITWTKPSQRRFEKYRDGVEARGQFKRNGRSPGNEQKWFRSTVRACNLGERGNFSPCRNVACWMCETIRRGFEPHLQRKRKVPWYGGGIRLGAGIYTSSSSFKADQYAENIHDPSSRIKAMLVCRVVIGQPYETYHENPMIKGPPSGYDCILGKPGWQSAFAEDEYVVYNPNAIRAAYLVLYEKAPDP